MRVVFAGLQNNEARRRAVVETGARHRLLTYYYAPDVLAELAQWYARDMKIYAAGNLNRTRLRNIALHARHRLYSYIDRQKMIVEIEEWAKMIKDCEFFLDSGAFSAWSKNEEINLEEYAQFVLDHPGIFDVVVNLDVIPGSPGVVPRQFKGDEVNLIEEAAARGWENYYRLEKLLAPVGVKPLHIYHQNEHIKWLQKLINEQAYFGVSPANDKTAAQRAEWLHSIMLHLTDARGLPIRKFHGFGVTSLELLRLFPWYSVDSTSWLMTANFGAIFVPVPDDIYAEYKVNFSHKSSSSKEAFGRGNHFDNLTPPEQRRVLRYIESLEGIEIGALREDYLARQSANIQFFKRLQAQIPPWEAKPWVRDNAITSLI